MATTDIVVPGIVIVFILALLVGVVAVQGAAVAFVFGWSFWRGVVLVLLVQGLVSAIMRANAAYGER